MSWINYSKTCVTCGAAFSGRKKQKACCLKCRRPAWYFALADVKDRFMQHVSPEPNSGCWLWTGVIGPKGYGHGFIGKGRTRSAHRAAYELFVGPIPDGVEIDHKCRVRSCVNPKHFDLVPHRVNVQRGIAVGEAGRDASHKRQAERTHCKNGHEFTEQNTRIWKGARICRTCKRIEFHRRAARRGHTELN